jgi:hypothetical protein
MGELRHEPEPLDMLQQMVRGLERAHLRPDRMRVLVTPDGWNRLRRDVPLPALDSDRRLYQHPGQAGFAMGLPVFIVASLPDDQWIKVQSMKEGVPLSFGLEIPS